MDEFNNRMEAQRRILRIVNGKSHWREELCGLSLSAIERWARVNKCEIDGELTMLLKEISKILLFLATKSQEQISEEYRTLSFDVQRLTDDLRELVR